MKKLTVIEEDLPTAGRGKQEPSSNRDYQLLPALISMR